MVTLFDVRNSAAVGPDDGENDTAFGVESVWAVTVFVGVQRIQRI